MANDPNVKAALPTPLRGQMRALTAQLDPYRILLFLLILTYTWLFAGLAFAQHTGMRTHKADLGQIAQSVWNSSRGRFVEMTDNGFVATRMTDHVEPILAIVSPVLWVWDDTRALLLLQAFAVALGAWPLYELIMLLAVRTLSPEARRQIWHFDPLRQQTRPLALVTAFAYLLTPQLQSALLTEFHAVPLAVPLILWALWAVEARRWWQFTIATLLVALVKEETALLAALLGLWAVWRSVVMSRLDADPLQGVWRIALLGMALFVGSLLWFYAATFVIVPAHAVEVYGISESTYFQRYGALGDSPADILRSFFTQPQTVWQIATEPARLDYLRDMLTPFGWLALLAPEVILLGAPVLLANQLSAYPAQYYGEFHYSAPVVVYFAAAAAFGATRLWRWTAGRLNQRSAGFQHLPAASASTMAIVALWRNSSTALRPLVTLAIVVWVLGWSVSRYAEIGRGPGGGRYDPTPITAHHRLLPRFTEQIPRDAAVTATAAVHPHVSLRRYVYQFPIGLDAPVSADWALLDVTTATDMAPGDVRTHVEAMLAGEWGVVDGADGFLLLHRGAANKTIPPDFYTFARSRGSAGDAPLTLLDATVDDWPRWRATKLVTVWQVGEGYDPTLFEPSIEIRTPAGETLYTFGDALPPALVWYPPAQWQPGDLIQVTTLPLYLPHAFGVVARHSELAITRSGVGNEQAQVVVAFQRGANGELAPLDTAPSDDAQQIGVWLHGAGASSAAPFSARFVLPNGERFILTAVYGADAIWPGAVMDVRLGWQGEGMRTWPQDVVAFVHLRRNGENASQQDGLPRYFVLASLSGTGKWADWRQLTVPPDALPAGDADEWEIVVGLYDPVQGTRLPVVDVGGNPLGDEAVVGTLLWREPPIPDQSCALIPATCASQVE